jgi:hypothetical protein
METHTIRPARRFSASVIAALFALVLTAGVLAVQLTSVWSATPTVGSSITSVHHQAYGSSSSVERVRVGREDATRLSRYKG